MFGYILLYAIVAIIVFLVFLVVTQDLQYSDLNVCEIVFVAIMWPLAFAVWVPKKIWAALKVIWSY